MNSEMIKNKKGKGNILAILVILLIIYFLGKLFSWW
jgi:hypothetical protein